MNEKLMFETLEEFDKVLNFIADYYGEKNQLIKMVEEAAELIVAIQKYILNPCEETKKAVAEEIADVSFVIPQITHLLDIEGEIGKETIFKLRRTVERIKNENK